jgi:hypothetical protein
MSPSSRIVKKKLKEERNSSQLAKNPEAQMKIHLKSICQTAKTAKLSKWSSAKWVGR